MIHPLKWNLTILCCFLMAKLAFAEVAKPDKIDFAIGISAPYGFYNQDNQITGTLVDIAGLLSKESGVPFEVYLVPTVRILSELESGAADFAVMPASDSLEKVAVRIGLISKARVLLVGRTKSLAEPSPYPSLSTGRVGHIRGVFYEKLFEEHKLENRVPLLSTENGVQMLLKRRIDYLVSMERTIAYHLNNTEGHDKLKVASELAVVETFLYASKKVPNLEQLKTQYAGIINRLNNEGTIKRVYSHLSLSNFVAK